MLKIDNEHDLLDLKKTEFTDWFLTKLATEAILFNMLLKSTDVEVDFWYVKKPTWANHTMGPIWYNRDYDCQDKKRLQITGEQSEFHHSSNWKMSVN